MSITRAIQKIVPQILKNCEVMPKTLHAKHRLSRLLNKCSGFKQNGMTSKIVPQILPSHDILSRILLAKHRLSQGCCVYALTSSITRTIQKWFFLKQSLI
ncbi:hypothetical protein DOS81_06155 [Staphylococcus felis]|nr:hypothetical protein DOS81_06155 [Staphylococcus felis]